MVRLACSGILSSSAGERRERGVERERERERERDRERERGGGESGERTEKGKSVYKCRKTLPFPIIDLPTLPVGPQNNVRTTTIIFGAGRTHYPIQGKLCTLGVTASLPSRSYITEK